MGVLGTLYMKFCSICVFTFQSSGPLVKCDWLGLPVM
uniref:Uncharacterized protein n=1 Tax=Anguilla anguilla TaxID=7936 RepID=A0A0E9XV49_ANGAN